MNLRKSSIEPVCIKYKMIHKITREVLRGKAKLILVYAVLKAMKKKIKDARVKRGAEIGRDHFFEDIIKMNSKRKNGERKQKIKLYRRENKSLQIKVTRSKANICKVIVRYYKGTNKPGRY